MTGSIVSVNIDAWAATVSHRVPISGHAFTLSDLRFLRPCPTVSHRVPYRERACPSLYRRDTPRTRPFLNEESKPLEAAPQPPTSTASERPATTESDRARARDRIAKIRETLGVTR